MDKTNEARYEYRREASGKFWEPQVEGDSLTVRFGKIGTGGRTHTKAFPSPAEAAAEYRKLVCEKLVKGYKPTTKTVATLLDGAALVDNPTAIASLCIGEHVPDEIVADICGWATACIRHGMTPKQFDDVWNRLMEGEDENLSDTLGRTSAEVSELSSEFWLDVTEWDEGELYELYTKAVENGGDRFIWFNNNAYIDIVAIRGDPGARAIEVCVLQEENCKDKTGKWLSEWPTEAGPGAPIAYVANELVTLRSGITVKAA